MKEKELEFIKQTTVNYVDFNAFDEGEIYYIVNTAKHESIIAVCLSKEREKAIFKAKCYIKGDWGADNRDQFMIHEDTPSLAEFHVFPVNLSFLTNMFEMKLKIFSEVDLYMI